MKNFISNKRRIFALIITAIASYWLLDAFIDTLLHYDETFLENLLYNEKENAFRLFFSTCFLLFGILMAFAFSKQMVAEELRSEKERRSLFETVPYGFYECDTNGKIILANESYSRITGYSKDEILNMYIWDFMEPGQQKDSLPEYLNQLINEQPSPMPYIARNIKKDGQLNDVHVDWDYKRNEQGKVTGFVCVLSDITERNRADDALREAHDELETKVEQRTKEVLEGETRYSSLFENMLNGIAYCEMIFDGDGRPVDFVYLEVNDSFENLTGLKKEVVTGRKVTEVIPGHNDTHPELLEVPDVRLSSP